MTEIGPAEEGRPWLSYEQVLCDIPCRPGDEEAVISFMRNLPAEQYVIAQQFFLNPGETLSAIIVSAYEEASGKVVHSSAELAETEGEAIAAAIFDPQVGELRGVYAGDMESSLSFIEYLRGLDAVPLRGQFESLCEDHGSYWEMATGLQDDEGLAGQLRYLHRTLKRYQDYQLGKVRLIQLPESVIRDMTQIEQENSPEAKRLRDEQFVEAVRELDEWCKKNPVPAWVVELMEDKVN